MSNSPAEKAAKDPDGDGEGGGDASRPANPGPSPSPPNSSVSDAAASDASTDAGFIQHLSKRARKALKAAAEVHVPVAQASPEVVVATSPTKRKGKLAKPAHQALAHDAAQRKKVSNLDSRIMTLREHAVMKADDQAVVDVFVRVQRAFRTPADDKDPDVLKAMHRTYQYDDEQDQADLAHMLRSWYTGPRPVSIAEFKQRMRAFKVEVSVGAVPVKKASWLASLTGTASPDASADGDEIMEETIASASPPRTTWAKNPCPHTSAELKRIAQLTRGQGDSKTLPEFVKDTASILTAAFLSTVVATKTRGTVVAKLGGAVWFQPNAMQATLLHSIPEDVSGPSSRFVKAFKARVNGVRFVPKADWLIFTVDSHEAAREMAGSLLPVKHTFRSS